MLILIQKRRAFMIVEGISGLARALAKTVSETNIFPQ